MFSGTKGLRRLPHKEYLGKALGRSVQIKRERNQEDAARYTGHVKVIKQQCKCCHYLKL